MTDAIGTDVPPAVEGADAASAAGGETFTVTKNVLVGSLVGSGVQFNQNTFAAGLGEEKSFKQLEGKIMRLKPQFVRLFYNDAQATKPGEDHRPKRFPWTGTTQASFLRAVKLAQRTGATINVTWQAGPEIFTDPATHLTSHMSRFADVLETLVTTLGLPSLWVTIQNEPNDARNKNITPRKLQDAYVKLDELLKPAEMTVLGLNKLGAGLGAPTKEKCNYSIGGLTKGKVYNHYQWNHGGRGGLASFGKVTAGPTGAAEVKGVPLHAVFALTARTLPR